MVLNHLAELLKPFPQEEFINTFWGKSYKHVRGWEGKFSELMPWSRLNTVLQQHRLDFPRLRLTREGKSLPANTYLRYATGGRQKVQIPRLQPTTLVNELRNGATLVLDAVDELHEPLTDLAEGLELFFHERIQINSYAGWGASHGFDLHWDDHDVLVLQVAGRKRWSVYGETRKYPLVQDSIQALKPEHEPLWSDTLEDGDLLYIPRGWWHVAYPLDKPTLHLTVGIHNRTGIDLVRWLTEQMRAHESFRKDLPRFAQPAEQAAHIEELRKEFLDEWNGELLERYFKDQDAEAVARPRLSLPFSVQTGFEHLSPRTVVRLTAPRRLELKVENGVIEFSSQKKRWRFAEDSLSVLRLLNHKRICTVGELCEASGGQIESKKVVALVNELVVHGLLAVVSS